MNRAGRFRLMALLGMIAGSAMEPHARRYYVALDGDGTDNAGRREQERRAQTADIYAETPAPVESRQQRRARERAVAKAGRA